MIILLQTVDHAWWQYALAFLGAFLVDVTPIPLPPAFTVLILIQVVFKLNIWGVVCLGVAGSILGRTILTLYMPYVSAKIFKPAKNEDVQFLGKKMKENKWKGQGIVLLYSFLPLPTTPLFVAAGMGKLNPMVIIPAFFIGKFTSDAIAVVMGKYASENVSSLLENMKDWKTITGLILGILLLLALLFIDWRTLIQKKKFKLRFKIWN